MSTTATGYSTARAVRRWGRKRRGGRRQVRAVTVAVKISASMEAITAGPGRARMIGMSSRHDLPQPVPAMIRTRCSKFTHSPDRRVLGWVGCPIR